jgi:hypothetical protein
MRQMIQQMQTGELRSERMEQLMEQLARRLQSVKGKKQYGYLKAPLKSLVDEIVDELAKDPRVAAAYDLWYQQRENVLRTYKNDLPERLPLSKQKEFKQIRNMVIREAGNIQTGVPAFEEKGTEDEGAENEPEELDAEPENNHTDAQQTGSADDPSEHSHQLRDPSVLLSVTRLLHHMGNIFQENATPPTNQTGMRIDSKRRKQLLEKRLAMGHKIDDHEDQTQQQTM